MAVITAEENLPVDAAFPEVSLVSQIRTFLWLASGMFSVSALALAFLDYWIVSAAEQAGMHFLAAIVSAVLFGFATVLKLGPDEA